MTIPATQLTADRDRQFDDWAVTVTFRQVTPTYDPETQQVSELIADTEIAAIVGEIPQQPTPGTAAQHRTAKLRLIIKAEQLPNDATTNRIVHGGAEYNILAIALSQSALTYTLDCQKTT